MCGSNELRRNTGMDPEALPRDFHSYRRRIEVGRVHLAVKNPMELETAEEPPITLTALPSEVLLSIAQLLLPANGLADAPRTWRPALAFGATSWCCNSALAEACTQEYPAFRGLRATAPAQWGALLGGLHAGGCGRWTPIQPLRAVRPQQPQRQPVQSAPRLSGASLCTVGPNQLCIFGGRSSVSADTFDATYLVSISWSSGGGGASAEQRGSAAKPERAVAMWDQLVLTDARLPRSHEYFEEEGGGAAHP